jgi:hypothetical protein
MERDSRDPLLLVVAALALIQACVTLVTAIVVLVAALAFASGQPFSTP